MSHRSIDLSSDPESTRRLKRIALPGAALVAALIGGLLLWEKEEQAPAAAPAAAPLPKLSTGQVRTGAVINPETPGESTALPKPVVTAASPAPGPVLNPETGEDTKSPRAGTGSKTTAAPSLSAPAAPPRATPLPTNTAAAAPAAEPRPIAPSQVGPTAPAGTASALPSTAPHTAGPAAPAASTTPPRRGYTLSLAPLFDLSQAQALQQKLQQQGLSTQLEIRLHIGPFPTPTAAKAAREQVQSLGLAAGRIGVWRGE